MTPAVNALLNPTVLESGNTALKITTLSKGEKRWDEKYLKEDEEKVGGLLTAQSYACLP